MVDKNESPNRYATNLSVYILKEHPYCVTLDMLPLGFEDVQCIITNAIHIRRLRAAATNGTHVTTVNMTNTLNPAVVETVLKVSHGNAFWCKSIAEFIAERGVTDFMRSIDAVEEVLANEEINGFASNVTANLNASISASPMRGSILKTGLSMHIPAGASAAMRLEDQNAQLQHNPLYILVICRLEKMSSFLQVIVKYASIIGAEFASSTLQAILPAPFNVKLENSLELLLESSFIICCGDRENDSLYCFQNYLIRNALYDLTPPR